MTTEEAIRILDPETSREALLPYAYDPDRRVRVVEEACRVVCAALRAQQGPVNPPPPGAGEPLQICGATGDPCCWCQPGGCNSRRMKEGMR